MLLNLMFDPEYYSSPRMVNYGQSVIDVLSQHYGYPSTLSTRGGRNIFSFKCEDGQSIQLRRVVFTKRDSNLNTSFYNDDWIVFPTNPNDNDFLIARTHKSLHSTEAEVTMYNKSILRDEINKDWMQTNGIHIL